MTQPHDPPEWLNSTPPPPPDREKRSKAWIWVILLAVILLFGSVIIGSARSQNKDEAVSASPTTTAPAPPPSKTVSTSRAVSPTARAIPPSTPSVAEAPPPVAKKPASKITGIGADPSVWDSTHNENPYFDNGQVYGDDPTLPSYLSNHGAVYFGVQKTGWVSSYGLNMATATEDDAITRIRQELPADATELWRVPLDKCHRMAFNSPTVDDDLGPTVIIVQLEDVQEDGSSAHDPQVFNQALFDTSGTPQPNPEIGC